MNGSQKQLLNKYLKRVQGSRVGRAVWISHTLITYVEGEERENENRNDFT